jgi:histidine ammonia-lyase
MNSDSLIAISQDIHKGHDSVVVDGESLTIGQIHSVARSTPSVSLTDDAAMLERVATSYSHMIQQVKDAVPIYGCNTGYGERASVVVNQGSAEARLGLARLVSEGIAHVDVSVGPLFSDDIVRAAILIRANMLISGVSAVKFQDLQKYLSLLNLGLTPLVSQYGGIGASGDLAHNARLVSALRQLDGVRVRDAKGKIFEAKKALKKAGLKPLIMDPKAGLGLVNGDNFSTAVAALLASDVTYLLVLSHVMGALTIEALKGTNRSFHPLLAAVRPHPGQKEVANIYRYLLNGSQLAYQEMSGHVSRPPAVKVQDGYSLRCISQYHGVSTDKLRGILDTIEINANSVSDNPLWVTEDLVTPGEKPWQWVSGGNFLAMHMSDAIDDLRKIITKIVKLNDRHLARLVSPVHNNGLPANLSDAEAITQCSFKGVQIQSGMFDVYSSLLSMPVSTMFGVHEEGNQDITSHALTSGILGLENLRVAKYSCAQNMLALAQAVDLRGGGDHLSPHTRPLYEFIRSKTTYTKKERPLATSIETLAEAVFSDEMKSIVFDKIFSEYVTDTQ